MWGHPHWKRRSKTALLVDNIILYIENTKKKKSAHKTISTKNNFSKVVGYKINIQTLIQFLYSSSEHYESEIKETITKASKRTKYTEINLSKEARDLFAENYKTSLKEIKNDLNKWKGGLYSGIGRLNIIKLAILPQLNCRFNATPIRICRNWQVDPKIQIEM